VLVARRLIRRILAVVTCVMSSASIAHAHGGMAGPAEIGPPLLTSGALGFVCYWVIMLWPSGWRRKSDSGKRQSSQGGRPVPPIGSEKSSRPSAMKRVTRLGVNREGPFAIEEASGR
jgi:hypothetical protein